MSATTHISISNKLAHIQNAYQEFATSEDVAKKRNEGNGPWFTRIDGIYFTEAPATTEQLMVNLHLVDEFGLNLPRDFEVTIHNALQTVQQSPEVWDAGLEKYAESADAARLLNQLFGFTDEIERALVNIKEGA